ncbi:6-phosphogluconolactonase, cycloisomerase 2 family [Kaistia soli DSM 19436]|uniref:6-phosphogluconolactonase, cycloisomerase 2 family n=1 Tax=Kaistia soli DSM 19436 TaxID=1122133 RepID=A0A1M5NU95_9HYPH|nr:beta-propeller fold lactonase family protein [Kaistia soli]SHG93131.1 6-phosphogluconolactonase, cycloisomerase 2 family [Kaistia soli DSM 19436]
MAEVSFGEGESLLVAARGRGPEHGLWRFVGGPGGWQGSQLATVGQLSSLCRHPTLPVVYGSGSVRGVILAWHVAGEAAAPIGEALSGDDPCFIAVDPSGRLLVAVNYGSSDLTLMPLAADGSFEGPPAKLLLEGGGPDPERQEAAHPHQALFHDGKLFVIDLGGDRIRSFTVDLDAPGAAVLKPVGDHHLPPGTGPRHGVFLPDGRLAVSGELASNLAVGFLEGPSNWTTAPGTLRAGPAKTRTNRNYPGDIQRSTDGAFVYLANRGHDTIAAFDVRGGLPKLVAEIDAGAAWPQHLLVHAGHLLVAGWDSARVMAVPLGVDSFAGSAEALFDCPGAGWLMLYSG